MNGESFLPVPLLSTWVICPDRQGLTSGGLGHTYPLASLGVPGRECHHSPVYPAHLLPLVCAKHKNMEVKPLQQLQQV